MASSSSSVFCQIGTASSATCSEISGTCGTGLSRVLARMKALRSAIMLALCCQRRSFGPREERVLCPPSSPTAFSAISTSCAPSAPTRPASTVRPSRRTTSRRATGSPSNAPRPGSRPPSTASAIFSERARRPAPRRCPARTWKARTMPAGSTGRSAASTRSRPSRAIKEAGGDAGVDVVVFCDEEGHFGSFLGSKSFTGLLTDEDVDKATQHDTTARRCAMRWPRPATPGGRA